MNYHYANENSQPVGPYTAEQMLQLQQQGVLHENSWVIAEGDMEWKPYAALFPLPIEDSQNAGRPKFCTSCGAENESQAQFCNGCGTKLAQGNERL